MINKLGKFAKRITIIDGADDNLGVIVSKDIKRMKSNINNLHMALAVDMYMEEVSPTEAQLKSKYLYDTCKKNIDHWYEEVSDRIEDIEDSMILRFPEVPNLQDKEERSTFKEMISDRIAYIHLAAKLKSLEAYMEEVLGTHGLLNYEEEDDEDESEEECMEDEDDDQE